MLFMLLGVEIEEHCSTEDKPATEKKIAENDQTFSSGSCCRKK